MKSNGTYAWMALGLALAGCRTGSQAQQSPLQFLGIRTGDLRMRAFLVGSFSYNSHIQMVPEFAGGAPALADPHEGRVALGEVQGERQPDDVAVEVDRPWDIAHREVGLEEPPNGDRAGHRRPVSLSGQRRTLTAFV